MSARRCSHCKRMGHNVRICRRAQADGFIIHQNVLAAIYRQGVSNNSASIKLILNNYTFHQLKIVMRSLHLIGPGATFIHTLYNYRIITLNNTLLGLKEDHLVVLMYYYLDHPPPNFNNDLNNDFLIKEPFKLDILSFHKEITLEDSSTFDCPICMESKGSLEKVICNCNHEICNSCMDNYLKHYVEKNNPSSIKPSCSLCRTNIVSVTLLNLNYKNELNNKYFL